MNLNDEGLIETGNSVILKPYVPRPFLPYEEMSQQEIVNGAGGTMFFDMEIFLNYFLLAFRDYKTKKVVKFEIPFNERKLSWIVHNYTIVGFNSFKFDLPLLWLAHKYQNFEMLREAASDLINGMWFKELQKKYEFEMYSGKQHIDLMEVCPLRGSLKLYAARLHSQRIQELPWLGNRALQDWQIPITADYCINNDLPATELLFENLREPLELREDLSRQYGQDLRSKSDAQIAEAVIGKELQKLKGEWPKKPNLGNEYSFSYDVPQFVSFQTPLLQSLLEDVRKARYDVYENEEGKLKVGLPPELKKRSIPIGKGLYRIGNGGLHSSEECQAVATDEDHELIDRDVASYYPAIVLNLKLFSEHLGPDFLTVYKSLVDRRIAAKKAKRINESENLKITINGTFGKLGSSYSILYAPKLMVQVTLTGQLCLLMLIEKLELEGIPVVSANTDGIVMRCPKAKKNLLGHIFGMWEQITGFVTEESEYAAVYSRDVNAYMAIKPNGEVKGKNVYYDPWRGKTAKDKYWTFQKNPNGQICIEAIEKFIVDKIPFETTVRDCSDIRKFVFVRNVKGGAHKDCEYLGKTIRWYYAKNVYGTINYIKSNNKVPDTEGAKPCMDLPEQFPVDVDYDWYINRTREMLYDMNYWQRPKQLQFW